MKRHIWNLLRVLPAVLLGATATITYGQSSVAANKTAETQSATIKTSDDPKKPDAKKDAKKKTEAEPTSQTVGEDAGDFTATGTLEFGYRGIRVDGDVNKFKSDLNYKAGPRIFDSSLLLKSKDGKGGGLFDTLLITSTGWGADPTGSLRFDAENPKLYRFEGSYRRMKYYRFLNSFANPNWLFTGFPVPPNSLTGYHGYNTKTQLGDFELTILPKNETIRFTLGYSPERYTGPFFTTYHIGGNEFQPLVSARSRADDYRFGADGRLGPIDWTFLQGFRRFKDDSFVDTVPTFINPNPTNIARYTSFNRSEPTRGRVNFTRASLHTLIEKRLDITGRIIYSKATSNNLFAENFTATNFNTRITGQLAPPNTLTLGFFNIQGDVERPNTVGDIGITLLATDKLRISNTFKVEDFKITGAGLYSAGFVLTRPPASTSSSFPTGLVYDALTKYRKYLNTIEGDYQFNRNYSMHLGYRYGSRREEQVRAGFNFGSLLPAALTPEIEEETNHTHAILGGFRMRPVKNWTLYFDAEHGTADNVFTRIGNYDYTNIRAKSRFAPNRKVNFNVSVITRNNANPSEIAGETLTDFGASIKSRTFQTSIDWMATPKLMMNIGYNYNWVNSDATIDYYYQVPPATSVFHHFGRALYYMRNNFFFIDATWRVNRRATLYTSYRINQDAGQGNKLSDPTGGTTIAGGVVVAGSLRNPAVLGGTLITSYPMNFQSPEARLAIRLNRHLDWNLGYQYFNYNEDDFVLKSFPPGSTRPQNYHAHLPYMSLRIYIGRKE
ncbi:MAG TPA: hypothetical protein VGQ72_16040 [Pyrinomonadaceae bacterium]|nr:hypothetical protein [Pyrinomonadaceae bacterium]